MHFITDFFVSAFEFIYEMVFGCHHNRQTRPFTIEAETYKVCLDCGRQIYYSTERMTPLSMREVRRMRAAHVQPSIVRVMPATSAERALAAEHGRKSTAAA